MNELARKPSWRWQQERKKVMKELAHAISPHDYHTGPRRLCPFCSKVEGVI